MEFNKTIGHVKWHEFKSPKGLNSSSANPNLMSWVLVAKFDHFSFMCFQAEEFGTHQIKTFELAPFLCHVNNSTKDLHIYMGISHGINGKW